MLAMMKEPKSANSFKSYIALDEDQAVSSNSDDTYTETLAPKMLSGEKVVAIAQNALMFTPVTGQKTGKSGLITVTNFRLSFVTSEDKQADELYYQENLLLGEHDVCLSCVDSLYFLSGDKKRKLLPTQHPVPNKIKVIFVMCKNMKVFTFSFKFSPGNHGRTVVNALLHHAFPRVHNLLFAYEYSEPYFKYNTKVPTFRDPNEWKRELTRTHCKGWRLSAINQNFQMSASLPQWLVVCQDVHDFQINSAAQHFRCNRPPIWCWSGKSGAALVRMADIVPTITDRVQENVMLETVRKSHPNRTQPVVLELTKDLPSPQDVETSYIKLRTLCAPDSSRQFWMQDSHLFSLLDNCKWLQYVSSCLTKSLEAANLLNKELTVVLQESDGRDMCCVISSLTMLLLDSHFRTIIGFQSLVQKEWVIMGHPFCTRLGHVYDTDMQQQSPLFLLFLDAVWQLLQQFPTCFQFTETYLTTVWDSVHVSIFDTFLFDCDRDRLSATSDPKEPLILRSLWDWGEMFPDKDIALFSNPFYDSSIDSALLDLQTGISNLQLWSQCYFRFLPLLEIIGGGKVQVDLTARALVSQIEGGTEKTCPSIHQMGSFFPFTHWKTQTKVPPASLLISTLTLNNSDADSQSVVTVID